MRYLRQALAMMREEKLYSAMYICGTALAIAFTMLIAEVYYIKTADIAPEVNRSKTYTLSIIKNRKGNDSIPYNFYISHEMYRDVFRQMETPECVMAEYSTWLLRDFYMKLADGIHDRSVVVKLAEPDYFRFYRFSFTEGAPFTQDDFDSERRVAVITEDIREVLFGKEGKAVGATIRVENRDYRICGVVKTPSMLAEKCCADIWFPYSADGLLADKGRDYRKDYTKEGLIINFCVPSGKLKAFRQELKEVEARYNAAHQENDLDMSCNLESYYKYVWENTAEVFNTYSSQENWYWYVFTAVFMLLFVPALNMSGMVVSRMERRLPEMAIRKAFGAKRRTLLWQVIMENLTLTVIGGFIGLFLAWLALYAWRSWIFYMFFTFENVALYGRVPVIEGEMFFAPAIFLITLLICCTLNVLAAALPAWLSLRKPIVESMMIKK